jgi:hypothetical protein
MESVENIDNTLTVKPERMKNYELIRTVLGYQTNVEQFLEVADLRNLVA